jgi:MoxR-like ATPase
LNTRQKFGELRTELSTIIRERDEVILGLLVALLSRSHIFLVGPPGTAKSLLIRLLNEAVDGAKFFDWLMTKTTTDNEIFGPPKFSALKQDRHERNTSGKLPEAHFAFLDEIWKSSSSIANTLLTAINERIFHNNGAPMKIPLETLMAASNELPEKETLAAMWDRFLLRYSIGYLEEDGDFQHVLEMGKAQVKTRLTLDEIHEAQAEVDGVDIPSAVLEAVISIRRDLRAEGIQPSDRRYRAAMGAVRAMAWLGGRTKAIADDLAILSSALWDEPEHIPVVERVVISTANPWQRQADELYDAIMSAWKAVEDAEEKDRVMLAAEATAKINKAREELAKLKAKMELEKRDTGKVDGYLAKAKDLVTEKIAKQILGIGK